MSTDLYKSVKMTAGQEIRAQDHVDAQRFLQAFLVDGLLEKLVPGPSTGAGPDDAIRVQLTALNGANAPTTYAYALSAAGAYPRRGSANNKVQIAPGVLFQKINNATGDEQTFLPYVFDGTEEVTIANGDVSNPRVDIVQMKLELINSPTEVRVFSNQGNIASLDLAVSSTNIDTVIRARARGYGGNALTVSFVAGASLTLTEEGFDTIITYVDGVTTVSAVETLIGTDSTLIEVLTTGTGANILVDPGDTFDDQLEGGTDDVLTSQLMSMKRRVQCTLSVKQGTPAASPTYPAPDAGYVIVAGVVVGTNYVAAASLKHVDTSGATAVLHDQRFPIGRVRGHNVLPINFMGLTNWTLDATRQFISAAASAGTLVIPCPSVGVGRVMGVQMTNKDNDIAVAMHLARYQPVTGAPVNLNDVENMRNGGATAFRLTQERGAFEANHAPTSGPTVQAGPSGHGPPVWTNGKRCIDDEFGTSAAYDDIDAVCISVVGAVSGTDIYGATFYVAEGL